MAFPFLRLPAELREVIYDEILRPDAIRRDLGDGYSTYDFDLSLFRVSRQLYVEARRIFFRNFRFIRVETPWDEAQEHVQRDGQVPLVMAGRHATSFKNHILNVAIHSPEVVVDPSRDTQRFVLLLEDLPRFCQMWFYSDLNYDDELNSHLALTLALRNPHSEPPGQELIPAIQQHIFTSFRCVKRLSDVRVQGPHSHDLVQSMLEAMKIPEDSPEKCLEESKRLKDLGNSILKAGDPGRAIELYFESFKAMHIICAGHFRMVWADAWFDRILHGGLYDGQHGQIVRVTLRAQLVANVVKCNIDMANWKDAKFWGERTINMFRRGSNRPDQEQDDEEDEAFLGFPASDAMGKIYYRTGYANKQLGNITLARKQFRVAYQYLPRDETIRRELASVSPMLG